MESSDVEAYLHRQCYFGLFSTYDIFGTAVKEAFIFSLKDSVLNSEFCHINFIKFRRAVFAQSTNKGFGAKFFSIVQMYFTMF